MKASFSEFSFGFAYTFELSDLWRGHLIGFPDFPSQIKEGRQNGGYDVRLKSTKGFVYCTQFKISEHMFGIGAFEHNHHGYPLPYIRFPIYGKQRSNQHDLLLNLETSGLLVEYVAPLFIDQKTLSSSYKKRNLRGNVVRVKPSVIGPLPDSLDHRVICSLQGGNKILYSEPIVLKSPSDWGEITENGFEPSHAHESVLADAEDESKANEQTIGMLLETFTEQVMHTLEVPENYFEVLGLGLVEQALVLARTFLGADLHIFAEEKLSSRVEAV